MTLSPDHDTLVIQCTPHTFDNVWRKNSIVTIIFQNEWYICCYWLFLVYLHQVTSTGMDCEGCYSITQVYIIFIKTNSYIFCGQNGKMRYYELLPLLPIPAGVIWSKCRRFEACAPLLHPSLLLSSYPFLSRSLFFFSPSFFSLTLVHTAPAQNHAASRNITQH